MGSKPIGISGSRAATILGLNDWQSEFELWQRIMEEREPGFNSLQSFVMPKPQDNASIRWGTAFEDSIVKLAEEKAGWEIINREMLYYYHAEGTGQGPKEACPDMYTKVLPWGDYISCHIDGYYHDSQSTIPFTLHEGKTSSYWNWKDTYGEPGTDKVPAYVQCQVQHQLLCTGFEECIVSVLVFPKRQDEWEDMGWHFHYNLKKHNEYRLHNDDIKKNFLECIDPLTWSTVLDQMGYFHQYHIQANKDLQTLMINKYIKWWKKHIINKEQPVPRNTDDIKRLFPEPVGTIVATEEIESLCAEYKQIGQEISKTGRLGKRREDLKVKILDWMRKQDSIIDEDSREKTILRDQSGEKLVSWNGRKFR